MRTTSTSLHVVVWLGLIVVSAWCWMVSDQVRERTRALSVIPALQDVNYRPDGRRDAVLDVYLPHGGPFPAPEGTRRPAILAIHGGSWLGGSKTAFRPDPRNTTVARLTDAGLVAIAVDYQLTRPGRPGWPGALDDLREAVRWTRRHAARLGVDPDRIAALGQSAGGHLAAMLGTNPDPAETGRVSSKVGAVIDFHGPSDLADLIESRRHLAHDPARAFLGQDSARSRDRAAQASPVAHVTRDNAPMLLLHGLDDRWIPIRQSENLAEALRRHGVMHRLIVVPGARHGFGLEVKTWPERDLLPDILAFLENVWNADREGQARNPRSEPGPETTARTTHPRSRSKL